MKSRPKYQEKALIDNIINALQAIHKIYPGLFSGLSRLITDCKKKSENIDRKHIDLRLALKDILISMIEFCKEEKYETVIDIIKRLNNKKSSKYESRAVLYIFLKCHDYIINNFKRDKYFEDLGIFLRDFEPDELSVDREGILNQKEGAVFKEFFMWTDGIKKELIGGTLETLDEKNEKTIDKNVDNNSSAESNIEFFKQNINSADYLSQPKQGNFNNDYKSARKNITSIFEDKSVIKNALAVLKKKKLQQIKETIKTYFNWFDETLKSQNQDIEKIDEKLLEINKYIEELIQDGGSEYFKFVLKCQSEETGQTLLHYIALLMLNKPEIWSYVEKQTKYMHGANQYADRFDEKLKRLILYFKISIDDIKNRDDKTVFELINEVDSSQNNKLQNTKDKLNQYFQDTKQQHIYIYYVENSQGTFNVKKTSGKLDETQNEEWVKSAKTEEAVLFTARVICEVINNASKKNPISSLGKAGNEIVQVAQAIPQISVFSCILSSKNIQDQKDCIFQEEYSCSPEKMKEIAKKSTKEAAKEFQYAKLCTSEVKHTEKVYLVSNTPLIDKQPINIMHCITTSTLKGAVKIAIDCNQFTNNSVADFCKALSSDQYQDKLPLTNKIINCYENYCANTKDVFGENYFIYKELFNHEDVIYRLIGIYMLMHDKDLKIGNFKSITEYLLHHKKLCDILVIEKNMENLLINKILNSQINNNSLIPEKELREKLKAEFTKDQYFAPLFEGLKKPQSAEHIENLINNALGEIVKPSLQNKGMRGF